MNSITTPKLPNTSQINFPYPMAPRKLKHTAWSAKYMEHLYQNDVSDEPNKRQQRQGKCLFTEMEMNEMTSKKTSRPPFQNAHVSISN